MKPEKVRKAITRYKPTRPMIAPYGSSHVTSTPTCPLTIAATVSSPRIPDSIQISTPTPTAPALHSMGSSPASVSPDLSLLSPQIASYMPLLINSLPFMRLKSCLDVDAEKRMYFGIKAFLE